MGRGCTCVDEETVAGACAAAVEAMAARLRRRFHRPEAAAHAADYLRGLVADVERTNGWQVAERLSSPQPRAIQRVLDRYAWDADAVRDDLRASVVAALGDPAAVLVVDETGFPKQGRHSAGVARHSCGTRGKRANCQVGVFLGYASAKGHGGLARALERPAAWTDARARARQVGIPDTVPFQTKPQRARAMVERALDAGGPAAWGGADEVYGNDRAVRRALEARGQASVLAVRSNEPVSTWPLDGPPAPHPIAALASRVPADGWRRLRCGEGVQGPRLYDWASLPVRPALRDGWRHAILVRRHPERPDALAFSLVYVPREASRDEVVRAAGARWSIEDLFQPAKGQVGLDHDEVRSGRGWHRHITLALRALAALTISARQKGAVPPAAVPSTSPSPSPRSASCSSASYGPPPARRPTSVRSWPGRGGAAAIRRSPRRAIAVAA
jgi:SRSO17 transposase